MKVTNLRNGAEIASELKAADTFLKRLKGLMFQKSLNSGCGLHIIPCQSVHTFFMRFPIDVIYVNESLEVVGLDQRLSPYRFGKFRKHAKSVIEVESGVIEKTDTQIGDKLEIQKN
ncbi:DUF192 domain-containing protein [Alkalibacillus haloalkaliphilus]|uniref:DUF192 domain-containing protein n=1 Tax=Alkalibacillus haloalkaliphilus TaxID=94136 RepID=UPI002935A390|nr:DUF192 domain-containing protein [Alkalibacillus haloalkaliphilus]MDV2581348.1 DUF192 domain-containing protein [Alkalibacillus haloalkaliphilus]